MIMHGGRDAATGAAVRPTPRSFGNFLPHYRLQPLCVPNGIGRIERDSSLREQPLGFRIGARTVSRARIHHKNRVTASFDLLFQRSHFRTTIGCR